MTNKDIIKQYLNTGTPITKYQINKLNNNLLQTYLRKRSLVGQDISIFEFEKMDNNQRLKALYKDYEFITQEEFDDLNINIFEGANLHLDNITYFNKDIIFNNKGYVYLRNLTEINNEIIFNNNGGVILSKLNKINNKIIFNNNGLVSLLKLTYLNNNIIFNNTSRVILPENINFNSYNKLDITNKINIYDRLPSISLNNNKLLKDDIEGYIN